MRKGFSLCRSRPKVNHDEASSVSPAQPSSPPPPPPPVITSQTANNQVIRVTKHDGAYSLDSVRLTKNGPSHKVVITVIDKTVEYDKMRVEIDGVKVHEVTTQWNRNGACLGLNVDGTIVDFQWDLNKAWFCFRTRFADDVETKTVEEKLWGEIEECFSVVILGAE